MKDEGPYTNNLGLENTSDYTKGNIPKGFIFCNLKKELNFQRLKKRAGKGKIRLILIHQNLDDKLLKERINKSFENFSSKRDILKLLGIPFIEIDLNHLDKSLLNQVNSFNDRVYKHVTIT